MKKDCRTRRRLALFCALALICAQAGWAEEETPAPEVTQAPTQAATEAPTQQATQTPTEAPTQAPSAEATATPEASAESTTTPEASPEATATPGASAEATATPEVSPEASPSPEASASPEASPEASPSVEPSPTPAPGGALSLQPEGGELSAENVWQISLPMEGGEIAFVWSAVEGALAYDCEVLDSSGASVYSAQVAECRLALPAQSFATGVFTLVVRATDGENVLAEDRASFQLAQGGFPGGGFPSGGFGGGFGGSLSGMSGEMLEEEQGFRVTPGEALTSSHSSGTGDMRAYGTVELDPPEEAVSRLTLGGEELNVTLDGGEAAFTVEASEGALALVPVSGGERWSVSALALKVLHRSGVAEISLQLGGERLSLSTDLELQGDAYAALRAQGYVSGDFTLSIGADGVRVEVAGQVYALESDGTLAPAD